MKGGIPKVSEGRHAAPHIRLGVEASHREVDPRTIPPPAVLFVRKGRIAAPG
jgi:hypothetical protein